jgi:hypothetical protein
VEVAFGNRPFEVTDPGNPRHLRLRTDQEFWIKENALQLLIQRLPPDAARIAWIDPDVSFQNPCLDTETIEALEHHPVVQLFSPARDLGPKGEPIEKDRVSYGFGHTEGLDPGPIGRGGFAKAFHPGYGYAFRRDALDAMGGLFSVAITGAADLLMVHAILGRLDPVLYDDHSEGFQRYCRVYAERAKALRGDLGVVPGLVVHHYHGAKGARGYWERRPILLTPYLDVATGKASAFDPYVDLIPDCQGLWQLNPNKPGLRDAIRRYLRSRDEDGTAEVPWPTREESLAKAARLVGASVSDDALTSSSGRGPSS